MLPEWKGRSKTSLLTNDIINRKSTDMYKEATWVSTFNNIAGYKVNV